MFLGFCPIRLSMVQTLIVTPDQHRFQEIEELLSSLDLQFDPLITVEHPLRLPEGYYRYILIDQMLFSLENMSELMAFRKRNEEVPLLFLVDKVESANFDFVRRLGNALMLQNPLDRQELITLTLKMLSHDRVFHRFHKRFSVDLTTNLENFGDGKKSKAYLKNLSQGGAFAVADRTFRTGDVVFLNITLDQINKHHRMNAKVVWTGRNDSGDSCVGLRFVSAEEVYRNLLKM